MNKVILGIAILAILVVGAFMIMDSHDDETSTSTSGSSSPTVSADVSTSVTVSATKEFDVIAKNWEFVPNLIEVSVGDTVVLHVKSVDVAHGIAITQFNVKQRLEPNQEETVTFVADVAGTYPFYCNVFCGEGHKSMKGSLVVK